MNYMRSILSLTLITWSAMTTAQSVLSEGSWAKFGTTTEGLYKLDFDYLQAAGVPSTVDPRTIKLFNHGFRGALPQANSIERSFDPNQVAMKGVGTEDGKLDQGDYLIFYSQGPHKLVFDTAGLLQYEQNIYTDTLHFLLTYGGQPGKRVEQRNPVSTTIATKSSYENLIVYEKDEYNQLSSGRKWFSNGVTKSNSIMDFSYPTPNATGSVRIWTSFASDSEGPSSFDIIINETQLGSVPIDAISGKTYSLKHKYGEGLYNTTIDDTKIDLRIRFNHSEGNSKGFLDYYILGVESSFQQDQHVVRITPGDTYKWALPSAMQVWDVTDPLNATGIPTTSNGVSFTNADHESTLVVFKGDNFPAPTSPQPLSNQNLKSFAGVDAIIITHPKFLTQAKRLAEFHRSHDQMKVAVATTNEIYNEFSSGSQDITAIRDFFRYCYINGGNLKYGLLFGDASYDYKDYKANNTNYVPIYESRESAHNIFSHSSDDYYGFMESDEGEWSEGNIGEGGPTQGSYTDHTLELGIGRLTAKTEEEAKNMVDKIVRYKTATQTLGTWKQKIAYLADDGDRNEHMRQAEHFSGILDENFIDYNAKKLYLDRYNQDVDPGPNSPVTKDVTNTIKDGVFMFNYMGHGNEFQLTSLQELAIDLDVIKSLSNRHKLPLFVAATCEFGKYDNPIRESGAELLLSHDNGGAIALIATTRAVFSNTNEPVNVALHETLFRKINGQYPRLGDVIKNTKNESLSGPINRNFALLGDPMLRLNYPQYDITLNQFKQLDTLSALDKVIISGEIKNGNTTVNDFNGTATITIWDIPQTKVTKGDESDPYTFTEQTNALYRGEFSVVNGKYRAEVVLPKNISYKYQNGKLNIYASDPSNFVDAKGSTKNFVLGGTTEDVTADGISPEVKLYLNEPDFKSGSVVGPSSLFIAELSDESGINISNNGFSQGITLQLNDEEPIAVNEYYTAELDNYKKGYVAFPLQNLDPGKYTAKLKVSDTHNNFTESTVEFNVSNKPILKIYNALNYPNPVSSNRLTTFSFEHDREDEKLEVVLALYNTYGRLVNQWDYTIDSSPRKIDYLTLRLSTFQGSDLEKGIYLYRLKVSSTIDGASNEIVKRLIIIN